MEPSGTAQMKIEIPHFSTCSTAVRPRLPISFRGERLLAKFYKRCSGSLRQSLYCRDVRRRAAKRLRLPVGIELNNVSANNDSNRR
jgi:hypothetical protein